MVTTHRIGQVIGIICALSVLIALTSNALYMLVNPVGWLASDHWLFQKSGEMGRNQRPTAISLTGLIILAVIGYVLYDLFKTR